MNFGGYLFAFMVFGVTKTNFTNEADENVQNVTKFIGNLVCDAVLSDPTEVRDVVLLRMENNLASKLFDQIAIETAGAIVLNVDCTKAITAKTVDAISMIIVVTDST